jgi:hypothetical protein
MIMHVGALIWIVQLCRPKSQSFASLQIER